jgi:hypothetical protein
METNIKRIFRLGSLYHVRLECGHSFECSSDQLDRQQLYIGKRYVCGQCPREA